MEDYQVNKNTFNIDSELLENKISQNYTFPEVSNEIVKEHGLTINEYDKDIWGIEAVNVEFQENKNHRKFVF